MSMREEMIKEYKHLGYICKNYVPETQYKIREKLCLKGKQVPFDDFTKFVWKDHALLPIWGKGVMVEDGDKVVDFAPFISASLTDLLYCIPKVGRDLVTVMGQEAFHYNIFDTNKELLEKISWYGRLPLYGGKDGIFDERLPLELGVFYSLIRLYHTHGMQYVRDLSGALMILFTEDKASFVDMLMQTAEILYPFVDYFVGGKTCVVDEDSYLIEILSRKTHKAEDRAFGAVDCKESGVSDMVITDGGGVGTFAFLMICRELYRNWIHADVDYLLYLTDEPMEKKIYKKLMSCIGTDFAGRYAIGKATRVPRYVRDTSITILQTHMIVPTEGSKRVTLAFDDERKNSKMPKSVAASRYPDREINLALFRSMVASSALYGQNGRLTDSWVNCHYADMVSLQRCCQLFYSKEQIEGASIEEEMHSLETALAEQETSIRKEYDGWASRQEYNDVCTSNKKMESQIEVLESRVKELNDLLSTKQNIIDKLTDNISVLNKQMQSYYSDEFTDDEEVETDTPVEEMVAFLNDFDCVLVGGRFNLPDRCKELGWEKVTQIADVGIANTTAGKADFIVINTQFCSHKAVHAVKSKYKNLQDCIIYYNGTSVLGLVQACYDFLQNYLA